ncbi:MAG: antibiotic biosynthesis monooxygenase [Proteobacteria bacterium]|nr:antibiotic biosynthesis monooxygenase [Pseudomonadota bacterium]
MARHVSVLTLRCPPGRREEALAQFMQRRVLEVCRDAVPGFIAGRLLRSRDDEGSVCVICDWVDEAAFEQWMNSPRRNMDVAERLFEPAGRSALFEEVQALAR